ncbi:hypothetical protein NEPAR06_1019 [Nematocida parisii]|uniref:Uncharacterized protein n=1 Tax=Nematocida parisii (strain ERTm3) TaxID=935791 RepID=I3EFN7_NEMP3|nr:hypothetical protein NEQG_01478 [Nematocida parisii ERTm3]KAI5144528.1 hypothetical protein NEPAR07_1122 [Nematocida parisii]KAI5154293.1 hypothetical protein NEPAR06_1019 [Nematocida parisii]KAI5157382.1 hypothetical protein NEPAR05_1230 [Nematocida parisii]
MDFQSALTKTQNVKLLKRMEQSVSSLGNALAAISMGNAPQPAIFDTAWRLFISDEKENSSPHYIPLKGMAYLIGHFLVLSAILYVISLCAITMYMFLARFIDLLIEIAPIDHIIIHIVLLIYSISIVCGIIIGIYITFTNQRNLVILLWKTSRWPVISISIAYILQLIVASFAILYSLSTHLFIYKMLYRSTRFICNIIGALLFSIIYYIIYVELHHIIKKAGYNRSGIEILMQYAIILLLGANGSFFILSTCLYSYKLV